MRAVFECLFFVTLLVFFFSCTSKSKKYTQNNRLLSFKDQGVFTQDDLVTMDSDKRKLIISDSFNKKTDTIRYTKGVIYISYLRITSAASAIHGDIEIVADTIKLIARSDMVATEQNVDRMTYQIENKGNKHYFLEKY